MSYDFHIVRSNEKPITQDEWNALVAGEPGEWRIEEELAATNPQWGEVIRQKRRDGAPFTVWLGNPERSPDGVTFGFSQGRVNISGHAIDATDETDRAFATVLALAEKLRARVVGDDGEVYSQTHK
jgi:hypothetical protein